MTTLRAGIAAPPAEPPILRPPNRLPTRQFTTMDINEAASSQVAKDYIVELPQPENNH